jgi:hypothetical protein
MPLKSRHLLYLIFLFLLSGLLGYYLMPATLDWSGDYALYMGQAKSILEGTEDELLVFNTFCMEQSDFPEGPHLYPWGYPLLLAGLWSIAGDGLPAIQLMHFAFYWGALVMLFGIFRRKLGDVLTLALVTLFALNPVMLAFCGIVRSDIPFLFFAMLAIYLIQRIGYKDKPVNKTILRLLLGLSIFCASAIRSEGVMLLVVWMGWHFMEAFLALPRHKSIGHLFGWLPKALIPALVFVICGMLLVFFLPDGSASHLGHLHRIDLSWLAKNTWYYINLPSRFLPFYRLPIVHALHFVLFGLAIAGIYHRFRKDVLYWLYLAVLLPVFIAWPSEQGIRFIFTILPFYFYFLFQGISALGHYLSKLGPLWAYAERAPYALTMLLLLGYTVTTIHNMAYQENHPKDYAYAKYPDGPSETHTEELFHFIKTKTNQKDLMVFRRPRVLSLMTGRKAIRETRLEKLKNLSGAYVIYDRQIPEKQKDSQLDISLLPASDAGFFREIYQNKRFVVYTVNPLFAVNFTDL